MILQDEKRRSFHLLTWWEKLLPVIDINYCVRYTYMALNASALKKYHAHHTLQTPLWSTRMVYYIYPGFSVLGNRICLISFEHSLVIEVKSCWNGKAPKWRKHIFVTITEPTMAQIYVITSWNIFYWEAQHKAFWGKNIAVVIRRETYFEHIRKYIFKKI